MPTRRRGSPYAGAPRRALGAVSRRLMRRDDAREVVTARAVDASRVANGAAAVGLVGFAGWLVALADDPPGAMRAWLTAWTYGLSVALGALGLVIVAYLTSARWLIVRRRIAEAAALSIPGLALAAVPLALGAGLLYPWTPPSPGSPLRDGLPAVSGWLDPSFVALRGVAYLAVWSGLALTLRRLSMSREAGADAPRGGGLDGGAEDRASSDRRSMAVAAAGLIVFVVSVALAALDGLTSVPQPVAASDALPGWEHLPALAAVLGLGFAFGASMVDRRPVRPERGRRPTPRSAAGGP